MADLYYLYEKIQKCLRELKTLAEAVDKTVSKPHTRGMGWIDHKYYAMKDVLENWGVYMTHIEFHTQSNSQRKGGANCKAFYVGGNKLYIISHIVTYLDVLAPVSQLSLSFEQNQLDPFKGYLCYKTILCHKAALIV